MFSIIIPAYNEQNAIVHTIESCKQVIQSIGNELSEVIVVDDGSNDNTAIEAQNAGAKTVRHPHNIGYGRSLKDGIKVAQNDIIIITDADGTYPINKIPDLLATYNQGFDMVVGARQGKHYDESFSKKIFRKLLKWLVEFTAGRKIPDINSGLRIFSKSTVVTFFNTLCDSFSFTTSLTLGYMMTGKFVHYIPIEYHKRVGKTKVKLFRDSLRTMQFVAEAILYYNPIKIFIVFCIVLLFTAMFSFSIAFFSKLLIAYLLGIGCILLSILMFGLGFIAILLKQILLQQKNK